MQVRDLGTLDGPMLLYGGAYSNLQATNAMLDWADAAGIAPEARIFTGDAIAYCADPVAVWDALVARGGAMIAGNVERQLGAQAADCGCGFAEGSQCDALARDWYPRALALIDRPRAQAMARLPDILTFRQAGAAYAVVHGGAQQNSKFLFETTPLAVLADEIALLEAATGPVDCVIAGHSGLPFQRRIGAKRWINAGVFGMPPNDGCAQGAFVVLNGDEVRFHRLAYDHMAAAQAMQHAGMGAAYRDALVSGWWPNEDILPRAMRRTASPPAPADAMSAPTI